MVLEGVSLDERVIRDLAALVDKPLREKLERALFFSSEIVALTFHERVAVLRTLDGAPWRFDEVRARLMDCETWCRTQAGVA
ncbi:MAG: hypothetical protein M5U27_01920 [Gaiella sp.]|nr:hypothetical protein [Gaiella sp.]